MLNKDELNQKGILTIKNDNGINFIIISVDIDNSQCLLLKFGLDQAHIKNVLLMKKEKVSPSYFVDIEGRKVDICAYDVVVTIGEINLYLDKAVLKMFVYPDSVLTHDHDVIKDGKLKPVLSILKAPKAKTDEIYYVEEEITDINRVISDPQMLSVLLYHGIFTESEPGALEKYELATSPVSLESGNARRKRRNNIALLSKN